MTDPTEIELVGIEEYVVTGYTLADAMREGCSLSDQVFGKFGTGRAACGLRAAWLALKARGWL